MKRILIIAGEASGDLHAAHLIKETNKLVKDVSFEGIGGTNMKEAGANILIDATALSVIGITEVLKQFKVIFSAFKAMKEILKTNPPDLLILVDFPDFNLRLAKIAKKNCIKVLYYISPQVWAWRKKRIKIIRRCVDKMAVILPFEVDFYKKENVEAVYVGNQLLDKVHPSLSVDATKQTLQIKPNSKIIGLFPGSRKSEVEHIFPVMLQTAQLIKQRYPDVQFIVPLSQTLDIEYLESYIKDYDVNLKVIPNQLYNISQICDAVITASGTVTLEIALIGTPLVIIYKLSPITFAIVSKLVSVSNAGLCNIIAGERVAPELIQHKATPEAISSEITKILEDKNYNQHMRKRLMEVKNKMLKTEATNIGEVVMGCLKV